MENHFYHIRLAPLSVTIFMSHVHILRNGSYADAWMRLIMTWYIAPWWPYYLKNFKVTAMVALLFDEFQGDCPGGHLGYQNGSLLSIIESESLFCRDASYMFRWNQTYHS